MWILHFPLPRTWVTSRFSLSRLIPLVYLLPMTFKDDVRFVFTSTRLYEGSCLMLVVYSGVQHVLTMSNTTGCLIRDRNCLPFGSTRVHPWFFGGVRVAHVFSFLSCPYMCLDILSSMLWCPFRFPHKNNVLFIFTSSCLYEGSYLMCLFAYI